jgi:hypothetical protein
MENMLLLLLLDTDEGICVVTHKSHMVCMCKQFFWVKASIPCYFQSPGSGKDHSFVDSIPWAFWNFRNQIENVVKLRCTLMATKGKVQSATFLKSSPSTSLSSSLSSSIPNLISGS